MTTMKKTMPEDDYFFWLGDPETGRWVTIDEYNEAINVYFRQGFKTVDEYFRYKAREDKSS